MRFYRLLLDIYSDRDVWRARGLENRERLRAIAYYFSLIISILSILFRLCRRIREFKMQILFLVSNGAWNGVNDQLNAWHTHTQNMDNE